MVEQTYEKKNLFVLNADVAGYSRLMADDFESTTEMIINCRKIVQTHVGRSKGILVDFVGDNFLAVFDTAMQAIQSAITITSEIEKSNTDVPDTYKVRFRMGVDRGELIIADGRYFGDAVNIASRIQAIAQKGGICVSGRVYQELDEPALRFRPFGKKKLKNIPEEEIVYEFADLPSDGSHGTPQKSLSLEMPTIAILPLHASDIDGLPKPTAEIFKKDLIHRLSRIPQLSIIDAENQTVVEHGLTAARYMLETGIFQVKDRIRVYATLFDVTTMNIVKSYKWTIESSEFLERINHFTDDVAHSVEVELVIGEPAGLYAELDDPEAIEKIYQGWYHLRSDTRVGWGHALDLFKGVMESHPDQPYGYVLMAYGNLVGATNDWTSDPEATLSEARVFAHKGFAAGDLTGMSQAVEAAVLMSEGKHSEALSLVDQLEILRPTCDVTYGLEGSVRRYTGQWEKAIDSLDLAMHLTGVNKPWYPTVKSCSLFMGGKIEQAASLAEMVLEHQPYSLEALLILTAAQLEQGMTRRAKATAQILKEHFPSLDVEAWVKKNPYTSQSFIKRWTKDLKSAGLIAQHA